MLRILGMYGLTMIITIAACSTDDRGGAAAKEDPDMSIPREEIRPSVLAGTWYPANADDLRQTVQEYLDTAAVTGDSGPVRGLVAPHAGYLYSGPVAAYAYNQVAGGRYDTVVIVAPNHADPRLNFSSVMTSGAYETPLGVVPVDGVTAQAVVDHAAGDTVRASDLGHRDSSGGRQEHSLEIQLPFLQVVLGEFTLVPVVMGAQDETAVRELASAIAAAVRGRNALLVASSDLSHFFDAESAEDRDALVAKYISAGNPMGLIGDITVAQSRVCGAGPIAAVMIACRELGAETTHVLRMENSYDTSGQNPDKVVGYLAAAIMEGKDGASDDAGDKKAPEVGVELGISDEEKDTLRGVVRETLKAVVNGGPVPEFDIPDGILGEEWGAFVTLNKDGRLRGCIGNIVGTRPLIETVAQMARAAALEDPRFPAVKTAEMQDITFEISVLTPIRKLESVEEIVIGRDGLIISRGWKRGLLLPQVATEYGWDRETFLSHTCRKAGLPLDAWKDDDTTMEIFSAEVFE